MTASSDVRLLVLGGELPDATVETLSRSGIDVSRLERTDEALEALARGEFTCVLVVDADAVREDDRSSPPLSNLRSEFPDLPILFEIDDVDEPWLDDVLATGPTDYVRSNDVVEHGELLAHRIRTLVAAGRRTFSRGADGTYDPVGRSAKHLRTLFEHAPDSTVVHDAEGEILDVNRAAVDALGYSREALLSMNVRDVEVGLDPDDLRDVWEDMPSEEPLVEEGVHRRKDGSTYPTEVWVDAVEIEGERQFIAMARDVTKRKERERELERYETFLEASSDMVTVIDEDGTIRYESPAVEEILGYEHGTNVDENAFEFVHPDDRGRIQREFADALERPGETHTTEVRFRDSDGEYRWLELRARIRLEDPAIEGVVVNSSDISERKEREQELERTRALLSDMAEMADVGAYEVDFETEEISWTDGMYEIFEIEKSFEPTLEKSIELYHPEDRDRVRRQLETLVESLDRNAAEPERTSIEARIRTPEGSERWVEGFGRAFEVDDTPFIRGYVMDVTERVEHERRLSALHEATRRLIDAESWGEVAEIAVEAASELLGFSLPSMWYPNEDGEIELVANSEEHQELLENAGTPEPVHPPDSWLWDVIESGETFVRSPLPPEDLAADVPLHSAIVFPLGEHGVLGCAARGEVDFTDRQIRVAEILARNVQVALDQLEQRTALERQQQFTADLLDAIEDVIYVLDTDGDLREWNRALEEVTGYDDEAIESMNAADFFADEDGDAVADAVEEAFETGRTRVELDFRTADGESIPYEFTANAFEDPDGEPVMAGIGRDRSLHVEYERTLEAQRDDLEVLNQVVRHDIRNDMTVVRGRANLLKEHVGEEGREDLEAILDATENAIELTRTARDLAETMLSEEDDVEPVWLDRHLDNPIENARSRYDDAMITVEDRLPNVRVRGNELLEAVFRNLIQNAIVHNDEDVPVVRISTTLEQGTVTVAIADNGPGIPDEQKETIFGKGEKGLDSPGTGIGLYLVRTLLEQYGGNVWVEDRTAAEPAPKSGEAAADSDGSVFYVELPRVDEHDR